MLDDKLIGKTHVREQVKKGLRALWLYTFIGRAWGLSPKKTLWLYKHVIIPKIMYMAVAWCDIMGIAMARSEMEYLQRAAYTMITRAIRTTSTEVLEMTLGPANTQNQQH